MSIAGILKHIKPLDFLNGSLEHESQAPKVFSLSDILGSLSMNNNAYTSNSNMNSKPKSDTSEQKCHNNLIECIGKGSELDKKCGELNVCVPRLVSSPMHV